MDKEDIIDIIPNSLDRDTLISFNELHEKLINQELFLAQLRLLDFTSRRLCFTCNITIDKVSAIVLGRRKTKMCLLPITVVLLIMAKVQNLSLASANGAIKEGILSQTVRRKTRSVNTIGLDSVLDQANWIFDSGVSHHVTTDLNNLSFHVPYDGTEELVIGDESGVEITHIATKLKLLQGTAIKGMYELRSKCVPPSPSSPAVYTMHKSDSTTWHHRLGHPHNKVFKLLSSHSSTSFSNSSLTSTSPLDLIFSDVWCSPITFFDNYKYYMIFVNHYTKNTWLYPLKNKPSMSLLDSKNLLKFFSTPKLNVSSHFTSCGISHLTSSPQTPQHNGYAKRRHRHIVETGFSLLSHATLPLTFWPLAFTTVAYLINRLPTPTLNNQSPYVTLFHTHPNDLAYATLGYNHTLLTNSINVPHLVFSLVTFIEHIFAFSKMTNSTHKTEPPNLEARAPFSVLITPHSHSSNSPSNSTMTTPISPLRSPVSSTSNSTPTASISSAPPPPKPNTRQNPKPNSKYHNSDYQLYTLSVHPSTEPPTIGHALKQPSWRAAMQLEFDALQCNQTWTLVPSTHALILLLSNGYIESSIIPTVQSIGLTQRPGLDYRETFSLILKLVTLRTLNEDVYIAQPPDFIDPVFSSHVCKLNKTIYGLKQAFRAWYDDLLSQGFKPTISDSSLFTLTVGSFLIYILVYVDDIIIIGPFTPSSHKTKFSLKDLGLLLYFLGVECIPYSHGLLLSQQKYITDVLKKTQMSECQPLSTSITCSENLTLTGAFAYPSPMDYRAIVGVLQYLSLTRPDVAFTVNKLSQFMHAPTFQQWSALKRLLHYLQGTISKGLLLRKGPALNRYAFIDADWAGNKKLIEAPLPPEAQQRLNFERSLLPQPRFSSLQIFFKSSIIICLRPPPSIAII
ncbi:hypothetical protein OSB04_023757 [Centaurea solstitialis]|uniref:Integrase catalytic domain-containing protein n=1 Tax=Centaurea solstitialis TaxID=347529 RepID=A0AA38SJU2_9ASTR|nr:hypothetical protein OSB04_023757 [Centaurea solstitialis]